MSREGVTRTTAHERWGGGGGHACHPRARAMQEGVATLRSSRRAHSSPYQWRPEAATWNDSPPRTEADIDICRTRTTERGDQPTREVGEHTSRTHTSVQRMQCAQIAVDLGPCLRANNALSISTPGDDGYRHIGTRPTGWLQSKNHNNVITVYIVYSVLLFYVTNFSDIA